jgi:hypothetical protein
MSIQTATLESGNVVDEGYTASLCQRESGEPLGAAMFLNAERRAAAGVDVENADSVRVVVEGVLCGCTLSNVPIAFLCDTTDLLLD